MLTFVDLIINAGDGDGDDFGDDDDDDDGGGCDETTERLLVALDTRSSWSLSLTMDTGQRTALFTVFTVHSVHKTQCTQTKVHTVHTAQSLMMGTALHCTSVPVTGDQTAPGDLLQGGNVSQQPGPVSISLVLLPQTLINVKKK